MRASPGHGADVEARCLEVCGLGLGFVEQAILVQQLTYEETRGQETSTTPTIDAKSLKDGARLPTPPKWMRRRLGL